MSKPTFASVTEIPCTCRHLEDSAHDPNSPIEFDAELKEYHFKHGDGQFIIYHCPFCGGAAPQSLRQLLFEVVSPEEQERLFGLFENLKTMEAVIECFGPPESDDCTEVITPETETCPTTVKRFRTLMYGKLSGTANVMLTDYHQDRLHISLLGKVNV